MNAEGIPVNIRYDWKALTQPLFWLGVLLLASVVRAQGPSTSNGKVVYAVFTENGITMDGRLDEPAWQRAQPTSDFIQKEPLEGGPTAEETEVRILYDKQNLYIGFYCYDRHANRLLISDMARDFGILDKDYVAVILDTFHDQASGYVFLTTPVGAQADRQFSDGGRINNVNWDGVWHVQARIVEDGYVVEMTIPFKTLRFPRQKVQVWGINFVRRTRSTVSQQIYWTAVPRRLQMHQSGPYGGELRGIENVEPGRNLYVKPYLLGGGRHLESQGEGVKGDYDAGFDIKAAVTPAMALDLTVNTDFSHTEVDTQQVNLTRFPLFFPEKRGFFLENAGVFQFGALQSFSNQALLFHSRTIGLVDGQPVPILGGARLTGRAGRHQLGLLNIQTRSERDVPATNFTATRLQSRILSGSDVGLMFLNRQSRQPNDHNRALGADVNLRFFQATLQLNGVLAKTFTPGKKGEDWMRRVEGLWESGLMRLLSSYMDIEEEFNPEMGFVRRTGRKMVRNQFSLTPQPRRDGPLGFIQEVNATISSDHVLFAKGGTESKLLEPRISFTFQNESTFSAGVTRNFERLLRRFEIQRGTFIPTGDYSYDEYSVSYSGDQKQRLSGDVSYSWGEFYDGTRTTLNVGALFRFSYHLSTSIDYRRNDVDLPERAFTTDLWGFRADYSFNPRMFLNSFIQYNASTKQLDSNMRFRFIHRPLSDIYVVYNDHWDRARQRADRSLTLKYTHLLAF